MRALPSRFLFAALSGLAACGGSTQLRGPSAPRDASATDAHADAADVCLVPDGRPVDPTEPQLVDLDLVLMVDNSGSMAQNQLQFVAQLDSLVTRLRTPTCVARSAPQGPVIPCSAPDAIPRFAVLRSLHVGVLSSDLGAPVSGGAPRVPGCPNNGDDGLLDPIARGASEGAHLPWLYVVTDLGVPLDTVPGTGLQECSTIRTDTSEYPPFLRFCGAGSDDACGGERDERRFSHLVRCNAALSSGGCGLESQLESVYRALRVRRADPGADPSVEPNAGFLRPDAFLALVLLTDEEDGSVRDGSERYPTVLGPADARSVYDARDGSWAPTTDLNRRFYQYPAACGAQDPTWPLERYHDPSDATRGFLGLKPGHPERVLFAAIAGVPLALPTLPGSTPERELLDWDALLGPPGPGGVDDFCGRNASAAMEQDTPQGPISMRHNNPDTACPRRGAGEIPACYREGATSSCNTYVAVPSRRIVEVARRFDQAPLCDGQPCHNGFVRSICAENFAPAADELLRRLQQRFTVQFGCR